VVAAQRCFLDSYSAAVPPERIARARLYESVLLVKAGARRVPVFDPDWERRIEAFVERAELIVTDMVKGPKSREIFEISPQGSRRRRE
jgi:hypothetical protein